MFGKEKIFWKFSSVLIGKSLKIRGKRKNVLVPTRLLESGIEFICDEIPLLGSFNKTTFGYLILVEGHNRSLYFLDKIHYSFTLDQNMSLFYFLYNSFKLQNHEQTTKI